MFIPRRVEFLIVGQGLTGTVLAHKLLQAGKSVLVIDQFRPDSASRVSAGLFNPFVFKWITKSWNIDELLPELLATYRDIEQKTGGIFLYQNGIVRVITTGIEADRWTKKSFREDFAAHLGEEIDDIPGATSQSIFGNVHIRTAGWLNVSDMLDAYRDHLRAKYLLLETEFQHSELQPGNPGKYGDIEFDQLIFCEGQGVDHNPYFNHLKFKHTKGEVLDIRDDTLRIPYCLNYGQFVVPRGEGIFRTGTTYNWKELDAQPTEAGRENIARNHRGYFGKEPEVVNHQAGVRPTSADRRPFVGRHPNFPSLAIFNATGAKGVLLAPWCAEQLVQHLLFDKAIHPELAVDREID